MIRILYIGDPGSLHDIKWASYFSKLPDFEVHFLVQEHEMRNLNQERKQELTRLDIRLEGPITSYSLWRFWENRRSLRMIRKVIDERKIDIVHPLFATPFALWTPHLMVPSVITTRGSDVHVVLSQLTEGSLTKRLHGRILLKRFKKAFTGAAAITCTSRGQAERVQELFGNVCSPRTIRTGINTKEIKELQPLPILPEHLVGKKVVFLPRFVQPIYRTEMALQAIGKLPVNVKSQLGIVLVRGARNNVKYEALIHEHLRECGVVYHMFDSVSQQKMWSLFKQSTLTIMAPKTDGTPNSALEAMTARCPIILGSFEYDQDLFSEKFCLRMKTDSPDELCRLIESALSSYPESKLDAAQENIRLLGDRSIEMERLKQLYLDLTKG